MPMVEHEQLPWRETRPGVEWRFVTGRSTGDASEQIGPGLTLFYQRFQPGFGVPRHLHRVGDEILTILAGEAEVLLGDDVQRAAAGSSVVVPCGAVHSFRNVGPGTLEVQCILSAEALRAEFMEDPQGVPAQY